MSTILKPQLKDLFQWSGMQESLVSASGSKQNLRYRQKDSVDASDPHIALESRFLWYKPTFVDSSRILSAF